MIENVDGMWLIKEDEYISKWAKETGRLDHDQWLLPKVKERLENYGCAWERAIDIGAYIGDHTIAYAQWFQRVDAYEPNREPFECLSRNMPDNVLCWPFAVGDSALEAQKYGVVADKKNPGASYLATGSDCPVFFNRPKHIYTDYIKIDVEGMELTALMACETLIAEFLPCMLIEQRAKDGNERLVRGFLDKYNYEYEPIQGEWGEQCDIWCQSGRLY